MAAKEEMKMMVVMLVPQIRSSLKNEGNYNPLAIDMYVVWIYFQSDIL